MTEGSPYRKWLDKKQYVRIEPNTGLPELIRIEPVITEEGEFIPDKVKIFMDEEMSVVDREDADKFIVNSGCVPMEMLQKGRSKVN
jgi:hypothetical protein